MPVSIFDVAKYILENCPDMTTWKLQKLCYYAQAWTVAWGEPRLFNEDFQAWSNGPVCPELFHAHQGKYHISSKDIPSGDSSRLSECQKENINIILRDYGNMLPFDLREQTHGEAPWKDARGDLPDGAPSKAIITVDAMGAYYGSL
ncbi:MAG: DUF4065 domain-containing protein [Clostridiales bacterium]|nr:DUF4065 domain-containing protein [Clostridiales bacterium]